MCKHGLTRKGHHNLIYKIWDGMKQRCFNSNNKRYRNYGGRGIYICQEWENDFKSFYNWAVSHGWEKGKKMDRKNNNKPYSPDNCHFTTLKINNQNRTISKWWFINWECFDSICEASKFFNTSTSNIQRWCEGKKQVGKKNKIYYTPPKPGCYSIRKYQ